METTLMRPQTLNEIGTLAHILIVDDDAALRWMIASFLEQEGFTVQTAGTGISALEHVERQRPALILLDMNLPEMDGWELAEELHKRKIDVPIVVMTAAAEARMWASQIGAAAYVAKPLSLPLLLSRIDSIAC
jgi:DNA-binding response OmpR family regulator